MIKIQKKNMETNNEHFQEGKAEMKPKKSNKWLYIILTILSILVLIFGVIFYLGYKKYKERNQSELQYSQERLEAINGIFSVAEYDNIPENYREHIYDFLTQQLFRRNILFNQNCRSCKIGFCIWRLYR